MNMKHTTNETHSCLLFYRTSNCDVGFALAPPAWFSVVEKQQRHARSLSEAKRNINIMAANLLMPGEPWMPSASILMADYMFDSIRSKRGLDGAQFSCEAGNDFCTLARDFKLRSNLA